MNTLHCTGRAVVEGVLCQLSALNQRGDTVDDAADEISGVGATGGAWCPEQVIALLLQAGYAYVSERRCST